MASPPMILPSPERLRGHVPEELHKWLGEMHKVLSGHFRDLQTDVGRKVRTYVQPTAPTTGVRTGDLWLDSDDGNRLYRWSGSEWVDVRDADIAQALLDAATAQAAADGKIVTFVSPTAPTADGVGDLWVDSDDDNKLHRWSGSEWVEIRDTGIAQALSDAEAAQTTADGKFSVEAVRCVGACALAPVLLVNEEVHGETSGAAASKLVEKLNRGNGAKKEEEEESTCQR